ncbi:MAG TPA: hypothetical protein VJL54_06140 [Nitrososphaera sp.]|nr:hypothetical protein [Nitrososphaera sp.]
MASTLVTAPVAVAKAFSPGHITGFFEIPSVVSRNPLMRGSRGAGFSVDRGIETSVQIYDSGRSGHEISINGVKAKNAEVSRWVVEEYAKLSARPYFVRVEHEVAIPIGFGMGSSGAAALSLSYALNQALGTGFDRERAAQIAHNAEITCRTGLGTVIAEYAGGFEMRIEGGAPGIGRISRIDLENYCAVILCIAPISTRSFLTNRIDEVNGLGGKMLRKLSQSRSAEDFIAMSREFADTLGLTGGRCKGPIDSLRASGFESSVAMFGETVFSLVPKEKMERARDALAGYAGRLLVCGIDQKGARVL